jgi:predicted GH43/DUF377 family glycosyl hydrolase
MRFFFISVVILSALGCQDKNEKQQQLKETTISWGFSSFDKADSINPILHPSSKLVFECPISKKTLEWEARNVLNPSAVVKNDTVYLFYRAQDSLGTSRIGLATSIDGLHFEKRASPVFYPSNDSMKKYEWNYRKLESDTYEEDCVSCYFDGVEDPRIIKGENEQYIMTYTAYDGKTARLALASSSDLINWTKHGLVLKSEKHHDKWSKSGAIVVSMQEGEQIAKKINGKYWMYFGDTNLFLASSDDLINWEVCENEENKQMIAVLHPRMGYFDSRLVEPGPYALYTKAGILLLYNGSNAANFNDTSLSKFTYAAGQALFDKTQPHKLIDRKEGYFIYPDKDYEKEGEVNEVCFVEGLVSLNNKWFLYYGTADSKIAVAVSNDLIE